MGLLEWVHSKQPSFTLSVCLGISLWACGHKGKIQSIAMWVHFAQDNTGRCSRISSTTWLNIEPDLVMIAVPARWWHRGGGGGGGEGGASYRRKWELFFVSCCEMGRMKILQDWLGIAKFGEDQRKKNNNVTNEAGCGFQMVCISCVFFAIAFSFLPHPCRAKQCPGCFLPYYVSSMSRAPPLGST